MMMLPVALWKILLKQFIVELRLVHAIMTFWNVKIRYVSCNTKFAC